jgi:hypothetical protein
MISNLKPILSGVLLGLLPIILCTVFYYFAPLVGGYMDAVHSFAMMGLYALGSMAVFISGIILVIKEKPVMGGVAILVEIIQLIIGVSFMAGT